MSKERLQLKSENQIKMTDYSQFKTTDFLSDDFFVRSILFPTMETERFWDDLIKEGRIDIKEYTDADLVLYRWKEGLLQPDQEDLEMLWRRIVDDCSSRPAEATGRRHQFMVPLVSVLASVAAALAILFIFYPSREKKQEVLKVDSDSMIITAPQTYDKVAIISNNSELLLDGDSPEIIYDSKGHMKLSDVPVFEKEESEETVTDETSQEDAALNENRTIYVPFGRIAKLELSDHSVLWINAGTSVGYPKVFSGDSREITVDGEIYAEIAHDGRPFIVHSRDVDVRVKGTSFDISSYSTDEFSRVVLVRGSVDVASGEKVVPLEPDQALTVESDGMTLRQIDPDMYTSWTEGVYRFENAPIEDVLLKLCRFYNVTFVLPKDASGIVCHGTLELKEDIDVILKGLMRIASFNYAHKDGVYYMKFN